MDGDFVDSATSWLGWAGPLLAVAALVAIGVLYERIPSRHRRAMWAWLWGVLLVGGAAGFLYSSFALR